jgi:hypothetical protein
VCQGSSWCASNSARACASFPINDIDDLQTQRLRSSVVPIRYMFW